MAEFLLILICWLWSAVITISCVYTVVFILQVIDRYCSNCLFAENAFKVSDELCGVVWCGGDYLIMGVDMSRNA